MDYKHTLMLGQSGKGKAHHPWDGLFNCQCGTYPWIVGKDAKDFFSEAPYKVKCLNCGKETIENNNVTNVKENWNNQYYFIIEGKNSWDLEFLVEINYKDEIIYKIYNVLKNSFINTDVYEWLNNFLEENEDDTILNIIKTIKNNDSVYKNLKIGKLLNDALLDAEHPVRWSKGYRCKVCFSRISYYGQRYSNLPINDDYCPLCKHKVNWENEIYTK